MDTHALRPATEDELAWTLAHALQFDGRRAFKPGHESMARLTAEHLADALRKSGYVVMKRPLEPGHSDLRHYEAELRRKKGLTA